MNILHNKPTFWKYETTASYVVLGLQYLYVLVFGKDINQEVAQQYVHLWYYDIMLIMPMMFFVFFSQPVRIIVLSVIFIGGLINFYEDLGFNSIVFNTFLSIFLANKFLLLKINDDEKARVIGYGFAKILLLFPCLFFSFIIESLLEYLGITHPETRGDAKMMTDYGRFLIFGIYYGGLAYIAYREARKKAKNDLENI